MNDFELIIRFVAISQLLFLAIMLLRTWKNYQFLSLALLLIGIASHLISPLIVESDFADAVTFVLVSPGIFIPILFFLFAYITFQDVLPYNRTFLLILVITVFLDVLAFSGVLGLANALSENILLLLLTLAQIVKVFWLLAGFLVVVKDWNTDLVESRREMRAVLSIVLGVYIAVVVLVELALRDSVPDYLEYLNLVAALIFSYAISIQLLVVSKNNFLFIPLQESKELSKTTQLSALSKQIIDLMENERAYAVHDLTIKQLAKQSGSQEYILRKTINGELGYRNFNAFVNFYRVNEISERLLSEEYRQTPLITLALDAGFSSLAPFNRVFKEKYGLTPSEFRKSNGLS